MYYIKEITRYGLKFSIVRNFYIKSQLLKDDVSIGTDTLFKKYLRENGYDDDFYNMFHVLIKFFNTIYRDDSVMYGYTYNLPNLLIDKDFAYVYAVNKNIIAIMNHNKLDDRVVFDFPEFYRVEGLPPYNMGQAVIECRKCRTVWYTDDFGYTWKSDDGTPLVIYKDNNLIRHKGCGGRLCLRSPLK